MKAHAEDVVSDEAFAKRAERWPVDTPDTKEAYFIREIFESMHFSLLLIHPRFLRYSRPFPNRGRCNNCCQVRVLLEYYLQLD